MRLINAPWNKSRRPSHSHPLPPQLSPVNSCCLWRHIWADNSNRQDVYIFSLSSSSIFIAGLMYQQSIQRHRDRSWFTIYSIALANNLQMSQLNSSRGSFLLRLLFSALFLLFMLNNNAPWLQLHPFSAYKELQGRNISLSPSVLHAEKGAQQSPLLWFLLKYSPSM